MIYEKIAKVRDSVRYIQKDAKVEGYKAITHDMVTSELAPHLKEHGIVIIPRQISFELRDTTKTTKGGTPYTVCIGHYEIDYVNIEEPDDKITVPIWAIAEDHGDKGPGKCVSYATKTANLKVFFIETGESEESRQEQKPAYISEAQLSNLVDMINATETKEDKFLEYLSLNAKTKITSLEKIPAQQFIVAISALENKRKKQND